MELAENRAKVSIEKKESTHSPAPDPATPSEPHADPDPKPEQASPAPDSQAPMIADEFMREIRAFKILHEKDYDEFSRLKNEIQSYKGRVDGLCGEVKAVSDKAVRDFEVAVKSLDYAVRGKESFIGAVYAFARDLLTFICVALIAAFLYSAVDTKDYVETQIQMRVRHELSKATIQQKKIPPQPQVQQQVGGIQDGY